MTTLTQTERTSTGWRCPRCGSTQEDTLMPVRAVECNCEGLGVPVLPVDKILGMLATPAREDGPVHTEPLGFGEEK